jgi:Cys-rich repeat protein
MLAHPRFFRRLLAAAVALAPSALLAAGCYSADVPIGGTGEGSQAVACQKTADCSGGLTCQAGVCAQPPACQPVTETCNGVDDDCDGQIDEGSLCPNGQACIAGSCKALACVADSDCGNGQLCVAKKCVSPGGCNADADCANGEVCAAGHCQPAAACAAGLGDCDGDAKNGCETKLSSDDKNCGACGSVCPAGTACSNGICEGDPGCVADSDCAPDQICENGTCQSSPVCAPGMADCDGDLQNGCETNVVTDAQNCGACGTMCPAGQACDKAACVAAACQTDADCANGDLCQNGNCVPPGPCAPGQAMCGNACVDLATDAANCGACGMMCPGGEACSAGVCVKMACKVDADCPAKMLCQNGFCQ